MIDVDARISWLINDIVEDCQEEFGGGLVTAAAYDTAWLSMLRHMDRPDELAFPEAAEWLLREQSPAGSWGEPYPYDMLPTMAALLALIGAPQALRRRAEGHVLRARSYLMERVTHWRAANHESIGIEVILPHLLQRLERVGVRLDLADRGAIYGLMRNKLLRSAGDRLISGRSTLLYSLEAICFDMEPSLIRRLQSAQGHFGQSVAATAAGIMHAGWTPQAHAWLRHISAKFGGSAPNIYPIEVQEAAWALLMLRDRASVAGSAPLKTLLDRLKSALTPNGAAWCLNSVITPDGDDTSAVLTVLGLFGASPDPRVLGRFESTDRFVCWLDERNPSLSTNAHALEALLTCGDPAEQRDAIAKATSFLLSTRAADGSWTDKWHVSPFYSVMSASLALSIHPDPAVREELVPSAHWVLSQQRSDGGWGVRHGTAEETAYAILMLERVKHVPGAEESLRRGQAWLTEHYNDARPELWIAKQLYSPLRVVEAAVLSALRV